MMQWCGKMAKVKFVQLESQAFLTDLDFVSFTAAERGVYCTLILHLYCSDGQCRLEPDALARLCNCDDFEQVWEKVKKKFQLRNGLIRHKRVTKELARAKKFIAHQRKAGLASAAKRQLRSRPGPTAAEPAKTRRKEAEKEIERINKILMNARAARQGPSDSGPVRVGEPAGQLRSLHFFDALVGIIPPRSRSDRTCFRNLANWLSRGCAEGRFKEGIFAQVLEYAREARSGRNPAAVLMALVKKELGYRDELAERR